MDDSKVRQLAESMSEKDFHNLVDELSDDQLGMFATASLNYSGLSNSEEVDEDGFAIKSFTTLTDSITHFADLQMACWAKFIENPQINSHVRDYKGSLTGYGFSVDSHVYEIAKVIKELEDDPRNDLHTRMSQYVARSEIEGELFLNLTLHANGFIEIDFMDPSTLGDGGENNSGIYFHPNKSNFPLAYKFTPSTNDGSKRDPIFIPSINLAYFPDMIPTALKEIKKGSDNATLYGNKGAGFKETKGYTSFIVAWDKGYLTNRNVSHIRTTISWINRYEDLKRWEIDHKKSAASYLWVATIADAKAYRNWLKLTDEEKKSTGLYAKKTPGSTLILPPGISVECKNPALSSISNQDTDIMQMVVSGLNRSDDMVNGSVNSKTQAGVAASRGPQSDRTQDAIAEFERFLRYHLWRGIFFLRGSVGKMKKQFRVKEAVEFKDKEPIFKNVMKEPMDLIEFNFPTSEISDVEGKARAYLGVKHGSVAEQMGIPHAFIAKMLGIHSYHRKRLQFATEKEIYPDTPLQVQIDSAAETATSQEPTNTPAGKKVDGNSNGDEENNADLNTGNEK